MQDNTIQEAAPEILVLKFADSKVPVFKEDRNKDFIKYGEDNLYPEYLTLLFNKSAKHNAIITGKAKYIFGNGFPNGDIPINRLGETINDLTKKFALDIEIYGGFRCEVVWNFKGEIGEIYHVDFTTLRKGKEGGFYYLDEWKKYSRQDDAEFIPEFNPNERVGTQIFEYNEYRPRTRFYPLPSYIGCNNYIETDIEISKYYLSAIKNGMAPSKLVQFFTGDPGDEKKREIEARFKKKYAGSENAGGIVLVFNGGGPEKKLDVQDLSASDLDKQFVELNKTVQQEIFSGHNITSPMLFGIKTEGQLGGGNEIKEAYTIFQNTYSKPKAEALSKEIEYLMSLTAFSGAWELEPTDPVGITIDIKDVLDQLPKEFILEKVGVPKEMWGTTTDAPAAMANEHVRNLSGRGQQQLLRIIRQYGKGQLNEAQARTLIKTGLGLGDDQINSILGIKMSSHVDEIIQMFDACGESKDDYEILKSRRVSFSEVTDEEEEFILKDYFKTFDVTASESKILDLLKEHPEYTATDVSRETGDTVAYSQNKIDSLIRRGYINKIEKGSITSLEVSSKIADLGSKDKKNPVQVFIKYSYEGPQDSKNRPFCAKMMQLRRLYSREDIEKISQKLGYSVFDRRGGFWNDNGVIHPYCRHNFVSHIVVKK